MPPKAFDHWIWFGESITAIILLLSKDLGRLIVIAFLVAIPMAWYSVGRWLEGYAYKTEVGMQVYFAAGSLTLLISLATMSYQSVKAARGNPVESLRSE